MNQKQSDEAAVAQVLRALEGLAEQLEARYGVVSDQWEKNAIVVSHVKVMAAILALKDIWPRI